MIDLAPRKLILVRKVKNQKVANTEEIFYLKSQYLEHNPQERTFIPNIPSEKSSFEAITGNFFKIYKGRRKHESQEQVPYWWVVINGIKHIQKTNLSCQFEDWLYEPCRIKR